MQRLDATDPTRVGPYTLLGRLGSGGMGRVYLGRSAAGRTVAVKVVRGELAHDAAFRERFRREVVAARAVSGAFTAPLVDAAADVEVPWLATRFVAGLTLAEAVARRGPLPEAPLRALLAGIAEALAGIHAAGLVHRDLKPANVMLALDGPHVIDFGIARTMDGTPFTAAGTVMGTPGYMAPEQVVAGPTMTASDVFALGATILYAASGVPPFGGGSVPEVMRRVLHDAPDTSAVPAAIRGVVEQCLAKSPEQRPTPRDVIAYVERTGPPASAGSWLPPELTADIVAMDQVMAGGTTSSRPPDPVGTTGEGIAGATTWSRPPDPTGATVPGPAVFPLPTVPLPPSTAVDVPPRPPHAPPRPGPGPSRRKLVVGLLGVGAVAVAGGVAAAVSLRGDGGAKAAGAATPSVPGGPAAGPGTAPTTPAAVPLPTGPAGPLPPPAGQRNVLDGPDAVVRRTVNAQQQIVDLAVRAGSLIVSSSVGRHAFDGAGTLRWTLPVGAYSRSTIGVAADGRTIFVIGMSGLAGALVAAEAATGAKLWSVPLPYQSVGVGTVVGVSGDIVVATGPQSATVDPNNPNFVWAVDTRSTRTAWQSPGVSLVLMSPSGTRTVTGTTVGSAETRLQLVDPVTGKPTGWQKSVPRSFFAAAEVFSGTTGACWSGDNLLYASSNVLTVTGDVTKWDGATGEKAWSFSAPSVRGVGADPGTDRAFAVNNTALYCIDGRTGEAVWRTALAGGTLGMTEPVKCDAGNVYTVDSTGTLWAVDIATGATRWKFRGAARSAYGSLPWDAAGGAVYIAAGDNTISVLDASGR